MHVLIHVPNVNHFPGEAAHTDFRFLANRAHNPFLRLDMPRRILYNIKIIVLKFVTLSRFEWLSATDERHVCEFSCTCYLYAAQQPVCEFSWYLNWSFSGISQTHRSFCRISLFLITISPKK